jgi:hypothetical protein
MQRHAPRRTGDVARLDAQHLEQPPHRRDVREIRDVLQLERLVGQQARRHQR